MLKKRWRLFKVKETNCINFQNFDIVFFQRKVRYNTSIPQYFTTNQKIWKYQNVNNISFFLLFSYILDILLGLGILHFLEEIFCPADCKSLRLRWRKLWLAWQSSIIYELNYPNDLLNNIFVKNKYIRKRTLFLHVFLILKTAITTRLCAM